MQEYFAKEIQFKEGRNEKNWIWIIAKNSLWHAYI
jgi:hypothetical protein